jgi:hypothetical protein
MVAFRLSVNGELVAVAGIDGGHVLSAIVNSVENERSSGEVRKDIWVHLGGLVSGDGAEDRKHVDWVPDGRRVLAVGDKVLIEIVEVDEVDTPVLEKPVEPRPGGRPTRR